MPVLRLHVGHAYISDHISLSAKVRWTQARCPPQSRQVGSQNSVEPPYAGSDKDSRHPIQEILDLIEIIDSLSFDSLSSM